MPSNGMLVGFDRAGPLGKHLVLGTSQFGVATKVSNKMQNAMFWIIAGIASVFLGLVTLAGVKCAGATHDEDQ
jgi:hypothetical protein